MKSETKNIVDRLKKIHCLSLDEYEYLISNYTKEAAEDLAHTADELRKNIYGNSIYIRGLIEVSNVCKNNCYYCGIRRSNHECERYKLSENEIVNCVNEGYNLGFRTFVFQGGESNFFTDDILCDLIYKIKKAYPNCAVTLSLLAFAVSNSVLLFSSFVFCSSMFFFFS